MSFKHFIILTIVILNYTCASSQIQIKGGTTILAFATEDSIIIAADSKVMVNSWDSNYSETMMKIFNTGNFYYAFAGLSEITSISQSFTFSSHQCMDSILNKEKDIHKSTERFVDEYSRTILKFYETADSKNKILFEPFKHKRLLQFIIVQFIKDTPQLLNIDLGMEFPSLQTPKIKIGLKRENDAEYIDLFMIGSRMEITQFLNSNKDYLGDYKHMREKLACLIKLEADKYPNDVGFPVNEIIIKKGKSEIVTIKNCPVF